MTTRAATLIKCALITLLALAMPSCIAQTQSTGIAPKLKKGLTNTPEALIGERLFLETRFAQYFAAHCGNDVNRPLTTGDPVLAQVHNPAAGVPYPGPFAGKAMNCRSCHFVEEFSTLIAGTQRSYTDYSSRSPIPERSDGQSLTVRNSRSLVDATIPRHTGTLLHGDGEFLDAISLVLGTFTGRNFGWLPSEQEQAIQHIARVIREDNGSDELCRQYGGSYSKVLLGTSTDIPETFRIRPEFRIAVGTASDSEIVKGVSRLVAEYLNSLRFERDAAGIHTGSAYDMFLAKNGLPRTPKPDESEEEYSRRLLRELEQLKAPKFVQPYERWSRLHPHVMQFGELELKGLHIFLQGTAPAESAKHTAFYLWFPLGALASVFGISKLRGRTQRAAGITVLCLTVFGFLIVWLNDSAASASTERSATHVGNCVSCHTAPEFTDYTFHNTGAAQEEYDFIHGSGSFLQLAIPGVQERTQDPDRFLPPTAHHPRASGVFSSIPSATNRDGTDLGMWNVYANPDFPEIQRAMNRLLCKQDSCDAALTLPKTLALFRTPTLRDLGHSEPYLHTGRFRTIGDVLRFYQGMSVLARAGQLRNADPKLAAISLDENDIVALAAFLRSLDEDYDN